MFLNRFLSKFRIFFSKANPLISKMQQFVSDHLASDMLFIKFHLWEKCNLSELILQMWENTGSVNT